MPWPHFCPPHNSGRSRRWLGGRAFDGGARPWVDARLMGAPGPERPPSASAVLSVRLIRTVVTMVVVGRGGRG